MFARASRYGTLHNPQAKCTASIQHGRDMGSTWGLITSANKAPTSAQNLAPKWRNLVPTWIRPNGAMGAAWAQVEAHICSKSRTWPVQSQMIKIPVFTGIHDASCWAMFPIGEAVAAGFKIAPLWTTWAYAHHMASIWPIRQFGPKLGRVRPKFCEVSDTLKTFYRYFRNVFLALMRVRAKPCCPHWAGLEPNFCGRCPHTRPSCAL